MVRNENSAIRDRGLKKTYLIASVQHSCKSNGVRQNEEGEDEGEGEARTRAFIKRRIEKDAVAADRLRLLL